VDERDDTEGWVAVAPPYAAPDGEKRVAQLRQRWAAEGTLSGLRSLQVAAAALVLLAAGGALVAWLSRRSRAGEIG